MASGTGGKSGQTVKSSEPWNSDQLKQSANAAQWLLKNDVGYRPYADPTYTPFSQQTLQGLNQTQNIAKSGNSGIGSANSFLGNMTANNGMSSEMNSAMDPFRRVASGQDHINGGNYQSVYNDAGGPSYSEQNLGDYASGKYLNGEANPYFEASLNRGMNDIQNRSTGAAIQAGRYGSGMAARTTADALGDFQTQNRQQEWARQQGNMLQANSMMDAARQAGFGTRLSAAEGVAGTEGANIANRVNAATQQTGLLNSGLQRGLQSAALAPTLDAARYNDANKLMGVGQAYEGKTQEQINDAMARFNAYEARPWEQVSRYNQLINGQTGAFGTQTQPGTSPIQQGISGAAAGAGLLGSLGGTAALGPLGYGLPIAGGLLGAFA